MSTSGGKSDATLVAPLRLPVQPGAPLTTQGGITLDDGSGNVFGGDLPLAPPATGIAATDTANLAKFYGKACQFPPGQTYLVNGLVLTGAELWVGPRSTMVKLANAQNVPVVTAATDSYLFGFVIDGNGVNNVSGLARAVYAANAARVHIVAIEAQNCAASAIVLQNCTNSWVVRPYTHGNSGEPVEINGGSYNKLIEPMSVGDEYGYYIYGGAFACDVISPTIEGLTGTNGNLAQGGGVCLSGVSLCTVQGGRSEGHASLRGVYLLGSTDCLLQGVTANNNGLQGFDCDDSPGTSMDGCRAQGNTGDGVVFSASTVNIIGVVVTNLKSTGNGGNDLTRNGGSEGKTFVGNHFSALICTGNTGWGLQEINGAAGQFADTIRDATLSGNTAGTAQFYGPSSDIVLNCPDYVPNVQTFALGADVNLPISSATKIMDTPSLPVGTYKITATVTVEYATAGAGGVVRVAADGATAVLTGAITASLAPSSATVHWITEIVVAVVQVSAAGTVKLEYSNADAANVATAKQHDFEYGLQATGGVIEKMA